MNHETEKWVLIHHPEPSAKNFPKLLTMQNRNLTLLLILLLTPFRIGLSNETKSKLIVLPERLKLIGPKAKQQIAIYERALDGSIGKALDKETYKLTIANPEIVQLQKHTLIPTKEGTTSLNLTTDDGRTLSSSIQVSALSESPKWSFRNDIENILTKLNCNSGACHGALAGKGGFKLSLRGYDPLFDHKTITRESLGRRIEYADPAKSLLLTKPTGAVPHKGGIRVDVDSADYKMLSEWIL
ncbi:MAG: hypothetical protein VXZ38_04335, partial [Planctomycetota bacterium]|nr:hypothetical protein [Planctomycetota bacterium]